eukprot:GHVP01067511.1.p1 GENE.GHVP01067511.1~~GHVP01067511.1.p1  ORF type:complete len:147 (+),score=20.91 GHVP01067511.1:442-882(+)
MIAILFINFINWILFAVLSLHIFSEKLFVPQKLPFLANLVMSEELAVIKNNFIPEFRAQIIFAVIDLILILSIFHFGRAWWIFSVLGSFKKVIEAGGTGWEKKNAEDVLTDLAAGKSRPNNSMHQNQLLINAQRNRRLQVLPPNIQ